MLNPMHPEEPAKYYARLQYVKRLSIMDIADHMVSHGCAYDAGDVCAILKKLVSCMKHLMLEGYRLQLDDLGILYLTARSEGAVDAKSFTADNIRSLEVTLLPSDILSANLRIGAEFRYRASRRAQAAIERAEREGMDVAEVLGFKSPDQLLAEDESEDTGENNG